MNKILALNTSPIICLSNANLEVVLESAYYPFIIPEQVAKEVGAKKNGDNASNFIERHKNKIQTLIQPRNEIVEWSLGSGETSVLSFCMNNLEYIAVLDDRKARKCANTFGIQCTGTLGLLLNAYKRKIIPSLEESIKALLAQGLFIDSKIIENITLE
jgi:predicted nucleic acid-binding protein